MANKNADWIVSRRILVVGLITNFPLTTQSVLAGEYRLGIPWELLLLHEYSRSFGSAR